ncbi:MAG: hypothetical protein IJA30_04290 [Bacilli bacterium]|nr:hypothetical protein [Bacilli bacterium]
MKKIILILLIIIELFIIKIPKYEELNNLAIIKEIAIEYKENKYTIYLKEIIPIKDNQGINYKYKIHKETSSTIKKAYNKIKNKTKKKIYLNKVQKLKTNIKNTNKIKNELQIKPKSIIHSNNFKN